MTLIRSWHLTTSDGVRLEGRTYDPVRPAGELFIVHGLAEHLGRYSRVASFFSERHLRVVVYSQRGHGRSGGPRAYAPSFERLVDDCREVIDAHSRTSREHRLLYGHSMGGCEVLTFGMEYPEYVGGLVAASPFLRSARPVPRHLWWIAKVANYLFPTLGFNPHLDPELLTRDPRAARSLLEDPLWKPRLTARLGMELFAAGRRALARAPRLTVPTLLLHGSDDALTSPEASRHFAETNPQYCRFRLFEGMRHELHQDLGREEVLDTIWQWIDERLAVPTC